MKFTVDQQKAIDTRGKNILVAAAAGSGKTRVLVERIISQIIAREYSVDEILVVTFTNAAAAEMRERIEGALNERLAAETDGETARWLERQLVLLTGASIETFHAFCQHVIRQHIDAVDVDPEFRLAGEQEMVLLKRDVLEEMLEHCYERPERAEDLPAWERFISFADDYGRDRDDEPVYEAILRLYGFSQSQPFPAEWLAVQAARMDIDGSVLTSKWGAGLLAEIGADMRGIIERYDEINTLVSYDAPQNLQDEFGDYIALVEEDMGELERVQRAIAACVASPTPENWAAIATAVQSVKYKALRDSKKENRNYSNLKNDYPAVRAEFEARRNAMKAELKKLATTKLGASEEELAEDFEKCAAVITEYTQLTQKFMAALQAAKRERNVLDFNDLEHLALEILCSAEAGGLSPSPAALALREEFAAIMVDEYQDTNGVQEAIVSLIARENNRFIVGDVKQSIYRFRLADPTLFQEKYARFPESPGADDNDQLITMRQNFRSRAEVLAPINYIFDQVMTAEAAEIEYDERSRLYPGAEFPPCEGQSLASPLELDIVIRGSAGDDSASTDEAEGESHEELIGFALEAQYIADRIERLITEERPMVFDHGSYRPIEYRDIAILMRAVKGKAATLLETLRRASIPAYADVDGGYFEATEVRIVLALLAIIDNARQDIPLAAVLASPIGGFTLEELTRLRLAAPDGDLYDGLLAVRTATDELGLSAELVARADEFFSLLSTWRTYSVSHSVPELVWMLYRETGYYDYVGSLRGGILRQANLRMLADRAADYERTNYRGLFRFLRYIEELQRRDTDLAVARTLGASENVVRIMSIHKSKGLEFPVVIVADVGKQFYLTDTTQTFLLHKDLGIGVKLAERSRVGRQIYKTLPWNTIAARLTAETKSEEMRVLYVALTRAKERLILTGTVAASKLEKQAARWCKYVDNDDVQLPADYIQGAKSYLDWIAPAIARHADGTVLRELDAQSAGYQGPFIEEEPGARFTVNIIDESEVRAVDGVPDESDALLAAVRDWRELPASPAEERVRAVLSWHYAGHGLEHVPAKLTVTEIKRRFELADAEAMQPAASLITEPIEWASPRFITEAGGESAQRISAAGRGTAMHTVMQHIDFSGAATLATIRAQVEALTARGLLSEAEAASIYLKNIQGFMKSSIGERLRRARNIYRELPFSRMLAASRFYPEAESAARVFTQGVIDLLFEDESGALVLVDYKTDRRASASVARARYSVQLALYREAAESILERPIAESYIYLLDSGELVDMG